MSKESGEQFNIVEFLLESANIVFWITMVVTGAITAVLGVLGIEPNGQQRFWIYLFGLGFYCPFFGIVAIMLLNSFGRWGGRIISTLWVIMALFFGILIFR